MQWCSIPSLCCAELIFASLDPSVSLYSSGYEGHEDALYNMSTYHVQTSERLAAMAVLRFVL